MNDTASSVSDASFNKKRMIKSAKILLPGMSAEMSEIKTDSNPYLIPQHSNPVNLTFSSMQLSPCQEPIDQIYKLGKVIGGGQFGSVCIA